MLPHYFAKVRSSSFGISGRKCSWKRNIIWCLNTHPILIHLTDVLTYLFSQFPVPLKYFFVNGRRFYLNKCCELKQRFLHVWHGIDNAIDEWHGRLSACIASKRRTLRATIVTIFSHMIRDVSVIVKCDTGPIPEPWTKPALMCWNSEIQPLALVWCWRSDKKIIIQL